MLYPGGRKGSGLSGPRKRCKFGPDDEDPDEEEEQQPRGRGVARLFGEEYEGADFSELRRRRCDRKLVLLGRNGLKVSRRLKESSEFKQEGLRGAKESRRRAIEQRAQRLAEREAAKENRPDTADLEEGKTRINE